jgi:hypothetical protein
MISLADERTANIDNCLIYEYELNGNGGRERKMNNNSQDFAFANKRKAIPQLAFLSTKTPSISLLNIKHRFKPVPKPY